MDNLHFLVPMYVVLTGLLILSVYLVFRSVRRIHHHDRLIARFMGSSSALRDLSP